MGHLQFIYDVKSWPDYAAMQAEDPASDGAAIERSCKTSRFVSPHNCAGLHVSLAVS